MQASKHVVSAQHTNTLCRGSSARALRIRKTDATRVLCARRPRRRAVSTPTGNTCQPLALAPGVRCARPGCAGSSEVPRWLSPATATSMKAGTANERRPSSTRGGVGKKASASRGGGNGGGGGARRMRRQLLDRLANCVLSGWNILNIECPHHSTVASPSHGIALPLIQNAAGHVYCIACERYFSPPRPPSSHALEWDQVAAVVRGARPPPARPLGAQEEEEGKEEERGERPASHRRHDDHHHHNHHQQPQQGRRRREFAAPAGAEERTLFRQLHSWQEKLAAERDVRKCRILVAEVHDLLKRLQAVQLQRRY